MTRIRRPALIALTALLITATHPALAAWTLDGQGARVHFVTIKANRIAEVHRFGRVSGHAGDDGEVSIAIDLASVDTAIEIRDQRMRDMLFEVARFPQAVITATLDPARFDGLDSGQSVTLTTPATLALHGREQELELELQLTATAAGGLLVSSAQPVLVNAADFALARGVEQLREVAGLPSIAPVVPVTFSLPFDAD
jgi:polyisoprenoid-binding protein YceI